MKDDEVLELGKSFNRLLYNPDYKSLKKFISSRIQTVSTQILQTRFDRVDDLRYLQGQLIGLAMTEGYMTDIVERMNKVKEKRKNEERGRNSREA